MKNIAFSAAVLATAVLFGASAPSGATAGDLTAYRGQPIDLGGLNGVAYYTVETAGYRVVATLADTDSKAVRFEAVLSPGQSVVLSAPGEVGKSPARVEISRRDDRVSVTARPLTN